MDDSELVAVAARLLAMSDRGPGESPGCCATPAHQQRRSMTPSVIEGVSDDEWLGALALSQNPDSMNTDQMLRAMMVQNSLLIRDAMWRKQCGASGIHVRTPTSLQTPGSVLSSLSTSGEISDCTPRSSSGLVSPTVKKPKTPPPPKNFKCPLCCAMNNEKDFDRHVLQWLAKTHTFGPWKQGVCPGIQSIDHPLLRRFPGHDVDERVKALVADIRSLVHPGAYDSLSAEGSGREVIVAFRFAELFNDVSDA